MSQQEKLGGMLIFTICFLGFFIGLVSVGNDFFINTVSYREYVRSDLEAGNLLTLNYTVSQNVTYPSNVLFDFTSWVNVKINVGWTVFPDHSWSIEHIHHEFYGYYYDYSRMYWETEGTNDLYKADLLERYEDNSSLFYPVRDGDLTVHVWFRDHNHTRNDLEASWSDGKIEVEIGFGVNDYTAKLEAWDIVGRLLLFQTPEIMGLTGDMATILSFIIGLPFWVCIAYLIYRLLLLAIPFVSG